MEAAISRRLIISSDILTETGNVEVRQRGQVKLYEAEEFIPL